MRKPRRWRKEFPYYKVQVFKNVFQSWKDERRAFDTVEEAKDYINKKLKCVSTRIIVVQEKERHVLCE